MTPWLVGAVAAVVAASLTLDWAYRWALRAGRYDVPNARSSHTRATPRTGGLAIVVPVLGVAALCATLPALRSPGVLAFLAGGAMVAAVSFADDLRPLSFQLRLAVHTVASLLVIGATRPWAHPVALGLGDRGGVVFAVGVTAVALAWMVGLTNAYNFMDGIDGIAGSQAVVAGAAWACLGGLGATAAAPAVGALAGTVALAGLVFLRRNWSPASIFMGDVGSAFLGFVLAALPLLALDGRPPAPLPLVSLAVVWPFVFDAAFTFARRWRAGDDVFAAHRSHVYQRMVLAGRTHAAVARRYAMGAATCALAALATNRGTLAPWITAAALVVVAGWLLADAAQLERGRSGVATRAADGRPDLP